MREAISLGPNCSSYRAYCTGVFPLLCFTGKFKLSLDTVSHLLHFPPCIHLKMMMYRVIGTSGQDIAHCPLLRNLGYWLPHPLPSGRTEFWRNSSSFTCAWLGAHVTPTTGAPTRPDQHALLLHVFYQTEANIQKSPSEAHET